MPRVPKPYTIYKIYDKDDNLIASTNLFELFDTFYTIYDTNGKWIARTGQNFISESEQNICQNGIFYLYLNEKSDHILNEPNNSWIVASMVMVKSTNDVNRDFNGNTKYSSCRGLFYSVIVGMPIFFIIFILFIIHFIKNRSNSNQCFYKLNMIL